MKTIIVTELEKKVLETLSSLMYAELGFSDVGPTEIEEESGIEMKQLRGVLGSLTKKNLITIDHREGEGYRDRVDMWICYLTEKTQGLVENWVRENDIEEVELQLVS